MSEPGDNPGREEILSSEETETLLQGIEDGSVETGQGHGTPAGDARLYDFSNCERLERGAMPTLQIVNTRIARALRHALTELLRKPIEVEARDNVIRRFGEHMPTLPLPASLNLVRLHPLAGTLLAVPENALIYLSVDCFFGGRGRVPENEPAREFTDVEKRIISHLLEAIFEAIVDGWRPVLAVQPELIGQEQNPHFAAIASSGDRVIVTEFCIRHADNEAALQLIMPRAMLEPIEEVLDSTPRSDDTPDEQWQQAVRERLHSAPLRVKAHLAEKQLRLGDVLNLQAGDVIPVELPDQVTLEAAGTALFNGRAGASRKHNAIEILARIAHPEQAKDQQ